MAPELATKLTQKLICMAFQPAITGSLLAALKVWPEPWRTRVLELLPSWADTERFEIILKGLVVLGFLKTINVALNVRSSRNGRFTAKSGWSWPNEIAVVTGGCSGIGKAIVEGLAGRGVRVVILDIQNMPTDLSDNSLVFYFKCDITDEASVQEAAALIRKSVGNPSILVNNAGITSGLKAILEASKEHVQRVFAVNYFSHWTTTKEFLPNMIQQNKGHIVTVASLATFVAIPTGGDYCGSKAAVRAFHDTLNAEIKYVYRSPGIVTTVVHPDFVRTPLIAKEADEIERRKGRLLTPQDVAGPILKNIYEAKGGPLVVPTIESFISGIRGWPLWLQDVLKGTIYERFADRTF